MADLFFTLDVQLANLSLILGGGSMAFIVAPGSSVAGNLVGFGDTSGQVGVDSGIEAGLVTVQGNTFNGPNQLVILDSVAQLPPVSGALLTNLPAGTLTGADGAIVFLDSIGNLVADANIKRNMDDLEIGGALRVAGALPDGSYSCGGGNITITNGVITAIS